MAERLQAVRWEPRKWVWSHWQTLRRQLNEPATIPLPPTKNEKINPIALRDKIPKIPLDIKVYDVIPADDNALKMRFARGFTLLLDTIYPQMQPGLGEIEYDIHKAMDRAISYERLTIKSANLLLYSTIF